MSYGYRLNIEDIYLKSADEHWEMAKKEMVEVRDEDPISAETIKFRAPTSSEGISSSVQAIVGWAISLEAFVNLAWNMSVAEKMPSSNLNNKLMRQLSTIEKLKEILRQSEVELENKYWLSELKSLFELRNKLVHFKSTVEYVGFSFAPEFMKDFEEKRMEKYRDSLACAVREIGLVVEVQTDFIEGNYNVVYYDE